VKQYLVETSPSDASGFADSLWNPDAGLSDPHVQVVIDQYKLYVEMADRVSARRSAANTFFLMLNTAVFTAIGVFWKDPPDASPILGFFPTSVLVIQCMVWFWVIRSYRQLNAGKWAVVGAMERHLPTSPWAAEWTALGKGADPARYWPLTQIERWVPFLFAAAYIGGFAALAVV
jgi:hypothetical protein